MPQLSLAGLLIQQTQAAIYNAALSIATTIGLPVSSWQPGDPTRSLFYLESEILESLDTRKMQQGIPGCQPPLALPVLQNRLVCGPSEILQSCRIAGPDRDEAAIPELVKHQTRRFIPDCHQRTPELAHGRVCFPKRGLQNVYNAERIDSVTRGVRSKASRSDPGQTVIHSSPEIAVVVLR